MIGAAGIILLPGPNSLYVLSIATVRGVKAGYEGAFGIFVGDTVLLLLTALGAASLLRSYPALFLVVKYVGAAYLAWVGVNLVLSAIAKWRSREDTNKGLQACFGDQPAESQSDLVSSVIFRSVY